MEKEKYSLYELINALNGGITPVGETNVDDKKFTNLVNLCDLISELIVDIEYVRSSCKNSHEYSIQRAWKHADKFLRNCREGFATD